MTAEGHEQSVWRAARAGAAAEIERASATAGRPLPPARRPGGPPPGTGRAAGGCPHRGVPRPARPHARACIRRAAPDTTASSHPPTCSSRAAPPRPHPGRRRGPAAARPEPSGRTSCRGLQGHSPHVRAPLQPRRPGRHGDRGERGRPRLRPARRRNPRQLRQARTTPLVTVVGAALPVWAQQLPATRSVVARPPRDNPPSAGR
jgi:hypothetical protein